MNLDSILAQKCIENEPKLNLKRYENGIELKCGAKLERDERFGSKINGAKERCFIDVNSVLNYPPARFSRVSMARYRPGVVPNVRRNMSINALTLS
jgi:hypothetical protein